MLIYLIFFKVFWSHYIKGKIFHLVSVVITNLRKDGILSRFYSYLIHILFYMMGWSYIQTYWSDPGEVPLYWGFYLREEQNKKRRYCLICHIFKPQRCHHCSVCNRCVLNMDHHCPWINNCIGFYNRKFFILLLFYLLVILLLMILIEVTTFLGILNQLFDKVIPILKKFLNYFSNMSQDETIDIWEILTAVQFLGILMMLSVLANFSYFHFQLIIGNKTTIE